MPPAHDTATRLASWLGGSRASSATAGLDAGDLLPRPPGLIRRFWARHPVLADVLLALLVLVAGWVESADDGLGLEHLDLWAHGFFVADVVAAAALLVRRSRPLVTMTIAIAASCVLTASIGRPDSPALVFAVYAVAVYAGTLAAWASAAVAFGVYLLTAVAANRYLDQSSMLVVILVVTLLVGSSLGNRRRYLAALIARAEQLARERDQQAQLATAAERARIAREMHDIVAHSLSVMVRLADGADAVAETDPTRSREAVRQIGTSGREALGEMRRLLGILRHDDSEIDAGATAPQPTLADLDHLVESYRSAGLPVAVQQTGEAPSAEGTQIVIYRAVQEALTNALRYSAEPTRVLVKLDYGHNGSTLDVSDDGFLRSTAPSVGSGRGLVGLRERAALYGGTIQAGPRGSDGRGWRLHMTLPQANDASGTSKGTPR